MSAVELAREHVLAYRAEVQDLTRPAHSALDCRVLDVGVQNTPPGSALLGLGLRTTQPVEGLSDLLREGELLVFVLGVRGAPHLVSRTDLPLIAAAVRPVDEREAAEVELVAQAMRQVAVGPISRPELSAAVTGLLPGQLTAWCERCGSCHVREGLFRQATVQAGLELDPSVPAAGFRPFPAPRPGPGPKAARVELARRYLHLCGVARRADLAAWLGQQPGEIGPTWAELREQLTACRVAGQTLWALTCDLPALSHPSPVRGVHLLPTRDPFLLGDRTLVVPGRDDQRRLWQPLGSPGAILLDGQVVGTWRQQMKGARLQVTLTGFRPLHRREREAVAGAAEKTAALRGADQVSVTVAEPKSG